MTKQRTANKLKQIDHIYESWRQRACDATRNSSYAWQIAIIELELFARSSKAEVRQLAWLRLDMMAEAKQEGIAQLGKIEEKYAARISNVKGHGGQNGFLKRGSPAHLVMLINSCSVMPQADGQQLISIDCGDFQDTAQASLLIRAANKSAIMLGTNNGLNIELKGKGCVVIRSAKLEENLASVVESLQQMQQEFDSARSLRLAVKR